MTLFLANENFIDDSVWLLRARGFDVLWVREESPSLDDVSILAWATRTDRVVLTFDLDYGDLVFRRRLPAFAVVLFRNQPLQRKVEPAEIVLRFLERPGFTFDRKFIVVSRRGERIVPILTPLERS